MGEQSLLILDATAAVFTVVAVGAAARRIGILTDEADESLLRLVVQLLMPCLIFSTVSHNEALRERSNLLLPPLFGFGSIVLGFLVGMLAARLGRHHLGLHDARQQRTFAFCVGVYNYGFLAIPLASLLFSRTTLGVLFIHNIGVELAYWTLGVMLIGGHLGRGWWRHAINPVTVAIAAALGFNFLDAHHYTPSFCTTTIDWLGQSAIPMSLLLVGAMVADQLRADGNGRGAADAAKVIGWACGLRLGLLPAVCLLAVAILPATTELKRVVVVQAAMPAATFGIIMAKHYGGDPGVALRIVLSTSLAALATTPLWIQAGMWLLGLGAGG